MTIDERLQFLLQSTESLHSTVSEMTEQMRMNREATDKNRVDIDKHTRQLEMDAENIRALARIAEAHQRRLDDIDGGGR